MKYQNLYRTDEWLGLDKIDRAQLLLVAEGLKRGATIGGDFGAFLSIVEKAGLEAFHVEAGVPIFRPATMENSGRYKRNANPTFMVADGDILTEYARRWDALEPEGPDTDMWRLEGWFHGYPDCCVEEYCRKRTQAERAIRAGESGEPRHRSYRFGRELEALISETGRYPAEFDYAPRSFTPCGASCESAISLLGSYKVALDTLDPEAAKELVERNRRDFPQRYANFG